ncbi:MAG: HAD-IC family P-type ATPase [Lewinellaceae bacterium]|nr:HAD-IC family P-type ATPase [Lewinellaceae bacterium]
MAYPNNGLKGFTSEEVLQSRKQSGSNRLYLHPKRPLVKMLAEVATEPVFLLLLLTCGLYFAIGDRTEAWMMVGAVVFVTLIEIVQEFRSEKALEALRQFTRPRAVVIRNGERLDVPVEDIVVNDIMVFEEGERLPADGLLLQQNDFSVDEAILTGESLPVNKTLTAEGNRLYQGTTVASGMGIARVSAVGGQTEFGKLGHSIESIESEPTPLQRQIDRFVRQMLLAGLLAFIVVLAINFAHSGSILSALLFSAGFCAGVGAAGNPGRLHHLYGAGRLPHDEAAGAGKTTQNRGKPRRRHGNLSR